MLIGAVALVLLAIGGTVAMVWEPDRPVAALAARWATRSGGKHLLRFRRTNRVRRLCRYADERLELKIDHGSRFLMGDAGRMIVDIPRGEHRQYERTKLLDEFAVAGGEFARRADREINGVPHAAGARPVRVWGRRHQGIEG